MFDDDQIWAEQAAGVVVLVQIIIAVFLFVVVIFRSTVMTTRRGKYAAEFQAYGLPAWFVHVVLLGEFVAGGLFSAGIYFPEIGRPLALLLALAMTAAVLCRIKARDPWQKAVPASSLVCLSLFMLLAPPIVAKKAQTMLGGLTTQSGRETITVSILIGAGLVFLGAFRILYVDYCSARAAGQTIMEWLNATDPYAGVNARISMSPFEEAFQVVERTMSKESCRSNGQESSTIFSSFFRGSSKDQPKATLEKPFLDTRDAHTNCRL